jgi:hypothetical protein
MAVTWDMTGGAGNGVLELFADGQRRLSVTGLDPATLTDGAITVGSHANGNAAIGGFLDDLVVYNTIEYTGATYTVPTQTKVVPFDCGSVQQMGYVMPADLNSDCKVDISDLSDFVMEWLSQNDPANSEGSGFVQTW